ncbi:hypothetical protein [Sporomusa silvacetica]|uniref:hypothetical protein n=1 Tax=Sporomusa silvacetica TaxID=55504 RepID=UPI00359F6C6D
MFQYADSRELPADILLDSQRLDEAVELQYQSLVDFDHRLAVVALEVGLHGH